MIDDLLEVSDERGRAHFEVLVYFFADPEEPGSHSPVELNKMSEKGFDDLFGVGV